MLNAKVFGNGAAGNKGVIAAINHAIISTTDALLINSTTKDIPEAYQQNAIIIGDELNGAGKEMSLGKAMMEASLEGGSMEEALQVFLEENTDVAVIATSSEGGTGCGSSIALGKYISENVGIPVHLFIFTGFEDDGRGLENTLKLFNEIPKDFIVHVISNKKFMNLDSVRLNKLKAEQAANNEFCEQLKVIIGKTMVDSEQNIDDTDLNKLTNTAGYQMVETVTIPKDVKTADQINALIDDTFNTSKALETAIGCRRLGIIISANKQVQDIIDYSYKTIKEHTGEPFEIFQHVQPTDGESKISIIVAGMKLPKEEIAGIYDRYQQKFNMVDKEEDTFYGQKMEFVGSAFDAAGTTNKKKNFFKNKHTTKPQQQNDPSGKIMRGTQEV